MNAVTNIPHSALVGVETKWYGPTNAKDARIRVRRTDHKAGDPTKWITWDSSEGIFENHQLAAVWFIDEMGWQGDYIAASTGDGYVFARAPRGVRVNYHAITP